MSLKDVWLFNHFFYEKEGGRDKCQGLRVIGKATICTGWQWHERWINHCLQETQLCWQTPEASDSSGVWERRKLRKTLNKSKVLRCSRGVKQDNLIISLNGEDLEELECLRYLRVDMAVDWTIVEVCHSVGRGGKGPKYNNELVEGEIIVFKQISAGICDGAR